MPPKFTELAFTPTVKAMQTQNGSRQAYARMETRGPNNDTLTPTLVEFIGDRDGFYMGTVNANGWPYIQFRGGPAGFLKVLDEQTLGFADFWWQRPVPQCGESGGQRSRVPFLDGLRPSPPPQNLGPRHCGIRSPRLN
jgi:hypothetical protein